MKILLLAAFGFAVASTGSTAAVENGPIAYSTGDAIFVLGDGSETPVPGRRELRLVEAGAEDFVLAWVRPADGAVEKALRIPRSMIAEIEAEPEPWRALRAEVGEGIVVDFQREMLAAA